MSCEGEAQHEGVGQQTTIFLGILLGVVEQGAISEPCLCTLVSSHRPVGGGSPPVTLGLALTSRFVGDFLAPQALHHAETGYCHHCGVFLGWGLEVT